jgi:hypothetical protein
MTTSISAIYSAVASLAPKVNSKTIKVYPLTALPNSVPSSALPARLLLPVGAGEGGSTNVTLLEDDNHALVSWTISDLLLYKPVAQGVGLSEVGDVLVDYCEDYLKSLVDARLGYGLSSVTVTPGLYQYPAGSGNEYYGALVTLSVLDLIT